MPGVLRRGLLMAAGVVLGMALVAGGDLWQARHRASRAEPVPAPVSVPAGSYTAPGERG